MGGLAASLCVIVVKFTPVAVLGNDVFFILHFSRFALSQEAVVEAHRVLNWLVEGSRLRIELRNWHIFWGFGIWIYNWSDVIWVKPETDLWFLSSSKTGDLRIS